MESNCMPEAYCDLQKRTNTKQFNIFLENLEPSEIRKEARNFHFIFNFILFFLPLMFQNIVVYKLLPQSTFNVAPDTNAAPGESKKQTAEEISSGNPALLLGRSSFTSSKIFRL